MNRKVLVIVGPTGSGKTEMSLRAAHALDGEVVSADSMQVYRGMDIGTAKLAETDREGIPHHMLDIAEPSDPFSVSQYQRLARQCIDDIHMRGRVPILCGGSGLHVNSITHNLRIEERPAPSKDVRARMLQMTAEDRYELLRRLDAQAAARIHPNNQVRVVRALEIALGTDSSMPSYDFESPSTQYEFVIVGISPDRSALRDRLDARVDAMIEEGLIREVQRLRAQYPASRVLHQAIGYKELLGVEHEASAAAAIAEIKRNTKRFAKRQMTWFRRDPRINWFSTGGSDMLSFIEKYMAKE